MKKSLKSKLATFAGTVLLALASARGQEKNQAANTQIPQTVQQPSPIQCSVKSEWFNKYLFRNQILSENPNLQNTASATYKDFSLIGIGIYDFKARDFIEADVIGDITRSFGKLTASAGYAKITVPNTDGLDSQEAYAALSLDVSGRPSIKGFYDWDKGKGFYGEFSLSHNIKLGKLTDRASIDLNATLSADNHYYRPGSGLRAVTLGVGAPINLNKKGTFILTPKAIWQKPISKDFRNEVILGAGLEAKF